MIDKEGFYGSKTVISNTNDGSKVLLDKTIPTLEVVELSISNKNSNFASIGDELIIKVVASEGIVTKKMLINGKEVNHLDLTDNQFYASYFFKSSDNDGIVDFEINFADSSGNQGEVVNSSTDGSYIIFDKKRPSDFTTGSVISDGGNIIPNSWNSTNTHLVVNVPIDESDTTLINGELQVCAKIGANKWENIGQKIKITPEDLGKIKSAIIKEVTVESIIGFKENGVINVKSIIKDIAGNETKSAPSKNKIIIDQTPPIISRMTIESSNGYPSMAKIGDEIIIRFQADEKIQNPTFTIYGKEASAENKEGFIWTLAHKLEDSDPEGEIKFSHAPIIDIQGNPAIPFRTKNNNTVIDTTLYFENDNKFVGQWRYGNINGFGRYTWDGIGTYEGNWLDGKKHGKGTMVWNDGSKYEGGWALDKFNGNGTYYYNNGDIYIGEWKNGKKYGKGVFSWKSGDVYEGNWVEGKRSGVGVMIMQNGEKWAVRVLDLPD
tara:strand:- start:1589 stop:3064 length:1476 start_codon:yes stop_codon:yes gene_type:complete